MRGDGCDIWVAGLAELEPVVASLQEVLSDEERAYVEGLRDTRVTATLSRGLLRLLLAGYRQQPVDQVEIDRRCPVCGRPHGRPRLRETPLAGAAGIECSVSHGGDRLLLAFAADGPLGVDVEPTTAADDLSNDLLDFVLTAVERHQLGEVPPEQRRRAFLRVWTAKEACLKAVGQGLELPLGTVTLADLPVGGPPPPGPRPPADRATVAATDDAPPVELAVTDLPLGTDYVASLATPAPVDRLQITPVTDTLLRRWLADDPGVGPWP